MNLLEFVNSFIPKSVAIMQTDLCSADSEMLFTTLRTCVNHSFVTGKTVRLMKPLVTSFWKRYPHAALQVLKTLAT